jgi:inhibitor of cysteine peptidase
MLLVQADVNDEKVQTQIAAANASSISPGNSTQTLKQFSSVEELKDFLNRAQQAYSQSDVVSSTASGATSNMTSATSEATTAGPPSQAGQSSGLYAGGQGQTQEQPPAKDATGTAETRQGATLPDFSTTNVQVQNVDEPDYLKNDGKYLYILSGSNLTIVNVYQPEQASIVTKIGLQDVPEGYNLQNMFLNKDRLVIFYQNDNNYAIPQYGYVPEQVYSPKAHALILDISNRDQPKVIHDYAITGTYHDARMTGDYAYLVTTSSIEDYDNPIIPSITSNSSNASSNSVISPDVFYFGDDIEPQFNLNTITAINISSNGTADDNSNSMINSKTFLMGSASVIYMSQSNIYITYEENPSIIHYETQNEEKFLTVVLPLLPDEVQSEIRSIINGSSTGAPVIDYGKWSQISDVLQQAYNKMPEDEKNQLFSRIQNALSDYEEKLQEKLQPKTAIHRIAASNGTLDYGAIGEVPGRLLNQFSMDESGNRFRIATNSEYPTPSEFVLANNVYVMDRDSLNIVGWLKGIAKGEDLKSTRFMGDRLYMVTFERTDPFFVIDLSEDQPKVLGELKLPGYSTYLHPYDDNHIIGVGKETVENEGGGVQEKGIKVALFDVSDVAKPAAVDVFEIGSSGTTSDILDDHKAFLFNKEKNILSIPIYMPERIMNNGLLPPVIDSNSTQGEIQQFPPNEPWRGFFVFGIDVEKGFTLKGTIEHSLDAAGGGYGGYAGRSFYIGDTLYTVTKDLVKMNNLNSLEEINAIRLHDATTIADGNRGIIRYD